MMRDWYKRIIVLNCFAFISSVAFAYPSMEGIQEYQHNIHLAAGPKQELDEDIDRYRNAEDIWEVLRQEFSLQHYEDDPQVQAQIEWFMMHQDFLLRSATRAAPYLYYILQQARKRHLPIELVLLPIIESAYNPYAYSPAGASGIWQMMPGAASDYGIKHDSWYDGRRDVIASTKAALSYLSYLGNFFDNNWLLAMAAYDTGLGNVSYAINRNIRDGYSTDFWSLRLAQETRIYVPRLLALAAIVANPDRYPVYFPPVRNAPYLAQLDIGAQIDLKNAATLAGITFKQLMQLNSGFNRTATDPTGKHKLILPIERVAQFSENLAQIPLYQRIKSESYNNKADESLAGLENRFTSVKSPVASEDGFNPIKPAPTRIIKVDQASKDILNNARAVLAENEDADFFNKYDAKDVAQTVRRVQPEAYQPASPPTPVLRKALEAMSGSYTIQPGDTIYMTRDGDDINKIAKHFHLSRQELLAANPLDEKKAIHQDQRLVIPTHLIRTQVAKVIQPSRYRLASGDTIYMVRNGDTIDKIARRFRLTVPEIRIANLIADNDIRAGDRLIIPTHA
jgi:membrane-bound lytic murein transglycosylase D